MHPMFGSSQTRERRQGFTLVEMSLVILVLMTLVSVGFYGTSAFGDWKKGRAASDTLRTVYAAQRSFLADNPTTAVTAITRDLLTPYLPVGTAQFPTGTSLTGTPLFIYVGASPPYMTPAATSTVRYDPSGSNTDSLWDVGE